MNWDELDKRLTSEFNVQGMGTHRAQKALETILGDEWISEAVEKAIDYNGHSSELAMNCLSHISSLKAAKMAYEIYKTDKDEDRRRMSVWLIKHMHVKESYEWIEEFLNDKEVIGWGLGVLDQLLWCDVIDYEDERINYLLDIALLNSAGELSVNVDFIRRYLKEKE